MEESPDNFEAENLSVLKVDDVLKETEIVSNCVNASEPVKIKKKTFYGKIKFYFTNYTNFYS
jgi:hypothetical protein